MPANHINRAERLLSAILAWAKRKQVVRGLVLVGSHARGTARANSDIDIVLLAEDPDAFQADDWLGEIDWGRSRVRPVGWRDMQYGVLWSRHVRLDDDLEVEFGFAPLSWASTAPLDPGTRRVISGGCRILHDPDGVLTALCVSMSKTPGQTA